MTEKQFINAYVLGWYDCSRSNGLDGFLWDVRLEETTRDMGHIVEIAKREYERQTKHARD